MNATDLFLMIFALTPLLSSALLNFLRFMCLDIIPGELLFTSINFNPHCDDDHRNLPSYFALRALLLPRAASLTFPPAVTFLAPVEASWCSPTFSSSPFFLFKIWLRGSYAGYLLQQSWLILPCLPLIAACLLQSCHLLFSVSHLSENLF